jgi:hypothetical protein
LATLLYGEATLLCVRRFEFWLIALMMEAAIISETSVYFYETTRCNILSSLTMVLIKHLLIKAYGIVEV